MPFAVVQGKELTVLPKDLYIPPDALEVILEAFEGATECLICSNDSFGQCYN
jgi:segregation and condensation protein A